MLKLKNKLLKIMVCIFSLMFFGYQHAFSMENFCIEEPETQDVDVNDKHCAKVVFLGYFGSGKTTLFKLLNKLEINIKELERHTTQIISKDVELDINGTKVKVYFNDTSAEPRHKEIMAQYCKNAHIIFLVIDAEEIIDNVLKTVTPSRCAFEELVSMLSKYSPKSRVIVVPTKMGNVTIKNNPRAVFAEDDVIKYLNKIEKTLILSGKGEHTIDKTYYLTLKAEDFNNGKAIGKAVEHREKLYDIIKSSLKKYGIKNLPNNLKNFFGKIKEDRIFTQDTFFYLFNVGNPKEGGYNTQFINPDNSKEEKELFDKEDNELQKVKITKMPFPSILIPCQIF